MSLYTPITSKSGQARGQAWVTKPMLITLVLMATFPFWAEHVGLYQYLGIEVAIWMLYALGYNLLMGYTGLPAFGQGAFLGVGAYAYGLCYLNLSQNPLVCLASAALSGAASAGLVGCLVAHRRGIYFALLTIACGQVFWFISMKAHSVTGGEDGLLNIHRPTFAGLELKDNVTLFYCVLAVLAVAIVALWRLVHSPFGKALQAIRMNETRARFVGYNVWLTKWAVMALSGLFAGLSGGLLAVSQESAYPDVMSVHSSGFIVMAVLIGGGTVSFWGPVLGALVFIVARDLLGAATETWLLWYGLLFMGVVLFQPEGIAGAFQHYRERLARRPRTAEPPKPLTTEAEMALFEARHLSKRFGDRVVLEDISLSFEQGQLSGIMGPNGAGKSTCFNVLTGHFPPDRGQVLLDGQDITGLSPRKIAQKGVARSFQIMSLFDEFTVLENVLFALPEMRSAGMNPFKSVASDSVAIDKALKIVEQVGLSQHLDAKSINLSYGQRRALEIAVALAAEPRVLFLDEPTQGMGAEGRDRLLELILTLKRRFTIVMIEHDMDFLFRLADRVSVIHWGQVIAQGTPDELRSDPWVRRAKLGASADA